MFSVNPNFSEISMRLKTKAVRNAICIGSGSVDGVVALDSRGPRFESDQQHGHFFIF